MARLVASAAAVKTILASILACAALVAFSVPASAAITTDMVAYWNFDNQLDDQFSNNHGSSVNSTLTYTASKAGFSQAVSLPGGDWISVANESNFDFLTGDYAISTWIQVNAFTADWQAVAAKGDDASWRLARNTGSTQMNFVSGNFQSGTATSTNAIDLSDGLWHHVVAQRAGDQVEIYVDGVMNSVTNASARANNAHALLIGNNPDRLGRAWNGQIDDMAIWSRALAGAEIASLFNNGDGNIVPDAIPEPTGMALLVLGGSLLMRRRRRG